MLLAPPADKEANKRVKELGAEWLRYATQASSQHKLRRRQVKHNVIKRVPDVNQVRFSTLA